MTTAGGLVPPGCCPGRSARPGARGRLGAFGGMSAMSASASASSSSLLDPVSRVAKDGVEALRHRRPASLGPLASRQPRRRTSAAFCSAVFCESAICCWWASARPLFALRSLLPLARLSLPVGAVLCRRRGLGRGPAVQPGASGRSRCGGCRVDDGRAHGSSRAGSWVPMQACLAVRRGSLRRQAAGPAAGPA